MSFSATGAQLFENVLCSARDELLAMLASLPQNEAGVRISGVDGLRSFLKPDGLIGSVAKLALGEASQPVRAILFDKTAERNWSLGWHQDRTICVQERLDVTGFGPWTIKAGLLHVAPPFDLLARMVTLRVHLDDVPHTNAPLLIAPGSHRMGRVAVEDIEAVVRRCGVQACPAKEGDIWLYSTPILHASESAGLPARRRVLQIDYAAESLPGGLQWSGI